MVIAGSASTTATSRGSRAALSASTSLNGITFVCPLTDPGRPRDSGTTRSSSRMTSVGSSSPWYLPSKTSTVSRPVISRARRITSMFACVAAEVNCHFGIR